MLISTASLAALIVLGVGCLLLWSNPRRRVNRIVSANSCHWAAWLTCLHMANYAHGGLLWVRISTAVGAFLPIDFWLVGEVIAGLPEVDRRRRIREGSGVLAFSVLLAALCFTDLFIPHSTSAFDLTLSWLYASSPPAHPALGAHVRGWGYYGYVVGICALYGMVLYRAFANAKTLSGGRRLELQIWLFGGCATALTIIVTMALNALTGHHGYIWAQPLLVLIFYVGTAYAITTHRIFDATQLLRIGLNQLCLCVVVGTMGYLVFFSLSPFTSAGKALVPTVLVVMVSGSTLKRWLDRRFDFYPEDTAARQAAYLVAHDETRVEKMEAAFLDILRGWGRTEQVLIVTTSGGNESGVDADSTIEERVAAALRQHQWVTPERLLREQSSPELDLLAQFLADRRLGALVFSETPMLNVIVGVGIPASRRAFTYPQINQLQELAAIIESAFERSLMVMKIQHSEQLATVGLLGASLAHEIRNPLVSVKAIVQLLPSRYQEAAFREKFFRLISDEVVRIDRLTEQLLDLASPRVYTARPVDLHGLLKGSLDLVGPRAADKNVKIISEFQAAPDRAFTDPAAVTQVLLNLCFNAIQALDTRGADRWVKVATQNAGPGIELIVSDNGPGITPEMRARIFKPFQTTKSSGFGLGLTVCRDILAGLGARISIDKPVPGKGATFRVLFPCPP